MTTFTYTYLDEPVGGELGSAPTSIVLDGAERCWAVFVHVDVGVMAYLGSLRSQLPAAHWRRGGGARRHAPVHGRPLPFGSTD